MSLMKICMTLEICGHVDRKDHVFKGYRYVRESFKC